MDRFKGQFATIELNGRTFDAMLVALNVKDGKHEAKVKIKGKSAYYTATGKSNSISTEAIKRALLNTYAVYKEKESV